jgi:hypothetical protein
VNMEVPRIPEYALPSYVRTPEKRERFELSRAIAESISAENEPESLVSWAVVIA